MAIDDIYSVRMHWDIGGNSGFVTSAFHYAQRGAAAKGLAEVGDLHKAWWNAIKDHFAATVELEQVRLRRVDPLEPLEQVYTTGLPVAGTNVTDQWMPQAAVILSLRTANIGRSYRGRAYLPPPSDGEVDNLQQIALATCQDVANETEALFAAMNGGLSNYEAVVFSRLLGVGTNITTVFCDQRPRVQRRRANALPLYVT